LLDPPLKETGLRKPFVQSSILLDERSQKIIFIGDTLADRGHNDYFILIIFQRIYQQIEYYSASARIH